MSYEMAESQSQLVREYLAAWNRHDAKAVAATVAGCGTYRDPTARQALRGVELEEHVQRTITAFPDVKYEDVKIGALGADMLMAHATMVGTNRGPFGNFAPTHREVRIAQAIRFKTLDGRIGEVEHIYDRATLHEQLDLQVVVQPKSQGRGEFGWSFHMSRKNEMKPKALAITYLRTKSEEERDQLAADYSHRIIDEAAQTPGFISLLLLGIGTLGVTITTWADEDGPERFSRGGTHKKSVDAFFTSGATHGGITSKWTPAHIKLWSRCTSCERISMYSEERTTCRCGAQLPTSSLLW